jgi:hypothetical protein
MCTQILASESQKGLNHRRRHTRGTAAKHSINLVYGPGSAATSITVSPTFQSGAFFVRADLSFVHARDITPGSAVGAGLDKANQPRAIAEIGFIVGHNLQAKLP